MSVYSLPDMDHIIREVERLTRERDEARRERDEARAETLQDAALTALAAGASRRIVDAILALKEKP